MKKMICNEATSLEENPLWVLKESVKSLVLIEIHFFLHLQIHCSTSRTSFEIEFSVKDLDSPLKVGKS